MCLRLREVPYSFEDSIVQRTRKRLDKSKPFIGKERKTIFETPYQCTQIDDNGIIFSSDKYKDFCYDDDVHGEGVHSYDLEYENKMSYYITRKGIYDSYAFGVFGYGTRFDICSICLYIPEADTKHRESMTKGINGLIKCGKQKRFDRLIKLLENHNIDTTKFHDFKQKWHKYND